uniref:BRCA2 and CDKN1A-interacting protein n=1 Tax=Macaca nemestrina TaxID=9545 RepID=A0A2K6C921_MACNE
MASRSKRRAMENPLVQCDDKEEDEVEDEDENNDDSDEEEDEEDDVTDEKKLLQKLFLKDPVNTAELTDLLIQQNHIVSVIKQTDVSEDSEYDVDEDEVFGFISLLNLTERKGTQCAEQIQELILSFCEKNCEKSMVEQLDKFLNDTTKPVGLLLSERFINIPPQIALPMYQQLQKELAEAHRTNKPCGKCYFYLLISKTFVEKAAFTFANAEEELFYEKAILKFNYSVQEESDTCLGGKWSFDDIPMTPLQTVMLIPGDKMNEIMDKLKEYLSI